MGLSVVREGGWIMNSGVESNHFARNAIQHKSGYRLKFKKAVVFRLDGVFGGAFIFAEIQGVGRCSFLSWSSDLRRRLSCLQTDAFQRQGKRRSPGLRQLFEVYAFVKRCKYYRWNNDSERKSKT